MKPSSPIPIKPEPLAALQARYAKALERVFDIEAALHDADAPKPGQHPENFFDFEDGLRLLVSRDKLTTRIMLHISASFAPDSPIADDFRKQAIGPGRFERALERWATTIPMRFAELSGDKEPLVYLGISKGGNPQWMRVEEP